jgi:hypothetical protein
VETTKKSFWQKPENITSLLLLGGLVALVVVFFSSIAPLMALALQGGLYTLAFAAVVGVLLFAITNKEWRIALGAFYTVFVKKLTAMAVEMDPIAIIKKHLRNLQASIEEMDASIDTVAGENKKIEKKILENNSKMAQLMSRATVARNKMEQSQEGTVEHVNFKSAFTLDSKQAGRLKNSNIKYTEMLSKGKNLENILEKMYASAKFVLADMTAEVQIQEEEYKIVTAGYNAFESARKVLAGSPDEAALYEQAMTFMADDLGQKVGKIERFMKNTSGILTSIDIDNEQFAASGMKMIDDWTKMGDQMFITSPKEALKAPAIALSNSSFLNKEAQPVVVSKSKYR